MSRFSSRGNKAQVSKATRKVSLKLEELESRLVPSTLTASTSPPPPPTLTVGAGDVATLIADINAANASNTPTIINLTRSTYLFTSPYTNSSAAASTSGPNALPVITGNITINGNGAVLERDPSLGSNTPFRFFSIAGATGASTSGTQSSGTPAGTLSLSDLTLEGGLAQQSSSSGIGGGGGILNQGNLTLNDVTMEQNAAVSSGAASSANGASFGGGAILNLYGTSMLVNCTLASNLAEGGSGGAISNLDGSLNVITSTIAGNAAATGGAVYNYAMPNSIGTSTTTQMVSSTVNLTDSILGGSIGSADLVNDQSTGLPLGSAVVNTSTNNIVTSSNTLDGATTNGISLAVVPELGLLYNYGGSTPTIPLQAGSPALGAGASGSNVPTIDQNGVSRGSVIDVGASQSTSATAVPTVTTLTSTSTAAGTGLSVVLTATIQPTSGITTPTGTVLFMDMTTKTVLGSSSVTRGSNGQGIATLTTTAPAANDSVMAFYSSSSSEVGSSNASTTVAAAGSSSSGSSTGGSGSSTGGSGNSSSGTTLTAQGASPQTVQWLNQVYETLLNRPITQTELNNAVAALEGGTSPTKVIFNIEQTDEYRTDEVQADYQYLLGTAGSKSDVSYLVSLMDAGTSSIDIAAIIASSDAYYQNSGGDNQSFISQVYQDFLGHEPDNASQATWTNLLGAGYPRLNFLFTIVSTQEFLTEVVEADYFKYVGHAADPAGLQGFVTALSKGTMNNEMVVASIMGATFKSA